MCNARISVIYHFSLKIKALELLGRLNPDKPAKKDIGLSDILSIMPTIAATTIASNRQPLSLPLPTTTVAEGNDNNLLLFAVKNIN